MSFIVKDVIFGLYGRYVKDRDSYKVSGKGIIQRYNELLAEDMDEQFTPLLNDLVSNTIDPTTVLSKLIPNLEDMVGGPVKISLTSEHLKRKMIQYAYYMALIKGTKKSYRVLFGMLGIDVVITEYDQVGGFDSPLTLDSDDRPKFDSKKKCKTCSDYSLDLTGGVDLDPEMFRAIFAIINFCQPINAELRYVKYNGSLLLEGLCSIFVDEFGDLQFVNYTTTTISFTLTEDGDLLVQGFDEDKYIIINGDLIFN